MTGKEYSQQWADECGFTENQLLALDPNCVKHFNAGVLEGRAQLQAANIEKDDWRQSNAIPMGRLTT
jgi:hypothetical protein